VSPSEKARLALRVALAQSGDRDALDGLLIDIQRPLYAHVASILGDRELAFDVLQSSLLLVARRLRSLRDPRWFRAWAYRIATREAVRSAQRRARYKEHFTDDSLPLAEVPVEEPAYDPALVRACLDQIELLPAGARTVIRLHYLDELTLIEVAEALEIPLGTVKSRLAYGLAHLRGGLAG
jgi:RNA polymerase sigma factor (sigma-70 family)